MPVFDKKDKSRYAAFTRRTLIAGGGMSGGIGGAGGPALPAADSRRRRIYAGGRGQPREPAAARPAARPHSRPVRRRSCQQSPQLSRVARSPSKQPTALPPPSIPWSTSLSSCPTSRRSASSTISPRTKNSCRCRSPRIRAGKNSRASICICPICQAFSPTSARPDPIRSTASFPMFSGYVASVSPEDKENGDDPLLDLPGVPRQQARHRETIRSCRARTRRRETTPRSMPMGRGHSRARPRAGGRRQGHLSDHRPGGAAFRAKSPWRGKRHRRGDGCATMAT